MFRRKRPPSPATPFLAGLGFAPIEPASLDEVTDCLASFTTTLDERNTYANGLLTWVEAEMIAGVEGSQDLFTRLRHVIILAELTRRARDWHEQFPSETVELGWTKIEGVLIWMAGNSRIPAESYELGYAADIPKVIDIAYDRLAKAHHAAPPGTS